MKPINGDSRPDSKILARAFGVVKSEVRRIRRARRTGRIHIPAGIGMARLPRQLCAVCSKVWDFAMIPEGSLPTHGLCPDCKRKLADGFTIFVCAGKLPLFGKDPILEADGVAGKIVTISSEDYEKLQGMQNATKPKDDDVSNS